MKHILKFVGVLALLGALWAPQSLRAEGSAETKVVGVVTQIEMASSEAKEAAVTLKVKGQMLPVSVTDDLTLSKFRNKKIQLGDEIRCIYKSENGKNLSITFRKTAGC